jgi:serine/threonine-protein kinase
MLLPRRASSLLFAAALSVAHAAHAESTTTQKAAAEALFDDALKLMKTGRHAEACPKLEESQRIDPGVGTLLYLGECYENVGRTAIAWATFREAASRAGAEGQTERLKTATDRAARLEPKLAYLTVQVAPETRALPGLSVKLGKDSLGSEFFGVAAPVDPGEARIEVGAPGYASFTTSVMVEPGSRSQLSVPPLGHQATPAKDNAGSATAAPPATTAPPPTEAPLPPPAPRSSGSHPLHLTGLVLGGVGLVGLGVGSYFGLRAMKKNNDATDGSCKNGVCFEPGDQDTIDSAHDAAALSNVFFAAGGAALVSGAILFFVFPSSTEQSARVAPYMTGDGLGLTVGGRL